MRINYQAHYPVETRENFQLLWLWSETQILSSLMNHRLVWIQRQEDSCGRLFQESPHKRNNQQLFWQHIQWNKPRLFQQSWVSWSMVTSNVSAHLNTSSQSTVMVIKLKLRSTLVQRNKSHSICQWVNLIIKIQLKKNNFKDSWIIWKFNKPHKLKYHLKEVEIIFTISLYQRKKLKLSKLLSTYFWSKKSKKSNNLCKVDLEVAKSLKVSKLLSDSKSRQL